MFNTIRNALVILCILMVTPTLAVDFTVLVNQLPPIKLIQNGQLHGIAGDILTEIMVKQDIRISRERIHAVPWKDAFSRTLNTPGTICLTMARTPDRISLFKWVGPIYRTKIGLIAKKERDISLLNIRSISRYRVGTVSNSAPEKLLLKAGVSPEQLDRSNTASKAVERLATGKVDMLSFAQTPTFYTMVNNDINPNDYEMIHELTTLDLYIAFNKETDDQLIHKLQRTLDELRAPKSNGMSRYDEIISKYFVPGF